MTIQVEVEGCPSDDMYCTMGHPESSGEDVAQTPNAEMEHVAAGF